jgi:hypothetical protein
MSAIMCMANWIAALCAMITKDTLQAIVFLQMATLFLIVFMFRCK